ncbi:MULTISPECIES: helix-turn-helix domain-containing protein [unclassified Gordonia (in: high G+C Gram-positive bacteria)]
MTAVSVDQAPEEGLTPQIVADWRRRIGSSMTPGPNPTRHFHRVGDRGVANYIPALQVTPYGDTPFEEYVYWRPLSVILVHALLRTPCTTSRTPSVVDEFPSDFLLVNTYSMPGNSLVRQDGVDHFFNNQQHLAMADNRAVYDQTSFTVNDPVGIWIPTELLANELPEGSSALPPVVSDSPLARATAAFIRGFACEAAVRGMDVDMETELAAVDLVRNVIRQQDLRSLRSGDNAVFVREASRRLVEQHFRDPDFTADSIARHLHLSRRQLYRQLAGFGLSPAAMIADRRLRRAARLLSGPDQLSLERVAEASGFATVATLRNRFKAQFGMTPDQYRRVRPATPTTENGTV